MQEIIYQIDTNFSVDWDPEKLSENFPVFTRTKRTPYFDSTGGPHWQFYQSGVFFGRNFYINYKKECNEVAEKLKIVQKKIKLAQHNFSNNLINNFLNHEIHPSRVNLLKTTPGKDIQLHCDVTRNLCINIGLKNSNKWLTVISKDPDINNFEISQKDSFLINDGDVYLISIKNPHTAVCLNTEDLVSTRFLITYTII